MIQPGTRDAAATEVPPRRLSPTFPDVERRLTGVACKVWSADGLTYVDDCKHRRYGDDQLRLPHDLVHFAGTETEALSGHVDGALGLLACRARRRRCARGAARDAWRRARRRARRARAAALSARARGGDRHVGQPASGPATWRW